jgi:hypothetical protein
MASFNNSRRESNSSADTIVERKIECSDEELEYMGNLQRSFFDNYINVPNNVGLYKK